MVKQKTLAERVDEFRAHDYVGGVETWKNDGFKYVILFQNELAGFGCAKSTILNNVKDYATESELEQVEVVAISKYIKRLISLGRFS